MLALLSHLNHVGNDQLRHNLHYNFRCQLLRGFTLGNKAQGVLKQSDESLSWVDSLDFCTELFGHWILLLDRDLIWLAFAKVQRQPMGEALVLDGLAHFLLREGTQA